MKLLVSHYACNLLRLAQSEAHLFSCNELQTGAPCQNICGPSLMRSPNFFAAPTTSRETCLFVHELNTCTHIRTCICTYTYVYVVYVHTCVRLCLHVHVYTYAEGGCGSPVRKSECDNAALCRSNQRVNTSPTVSVPRSARVTADFFAVSQQVAPVGRKRNTFHIR